MAYLADSQICSQVIVSEAKIILVNEKPLGLKDCLSTKVKWLTAQMKNFNFLFHVRIIKN